MAPACMLTFLLSCLTTSPLCCLPACLQVYSRVDPRVRQLAFVVKYWARRRRINNASEGTLSSYAYILLILHFLQVGR